MATQKQRISLEQVAKEKLTKQILEDIDSIEIEAWDNVESGLFLEIGTQTIKLKFIGEISTKKFLAWSGSIAATIGGVIAVLKFLLPILAVYFSNAPP